jgi:hypothetical protein
MKKLNDFRLFLAPLIASACYSIAYCFKETLFEGSLWKTGLTIFIITAITFSVPKYLPSIFLKYRLTRRIIYGKNLLEGFWLLRGMNKEASHKLSADGLAEITFNTSKNAFQIIVTRLKSNGEPFTTNSKSFTLLDDEENVVNLFSYILDEEDANKHEGISSGQFFHSSANTLIDNYEGRILTFHNDIVTKQKGKRIPKGKIDLFQQEHGENWRIEFLKNSSK